jgi:hypothetical protein
MNREDRLGIIAGIAAWAVIGSLIYWFHADPKEVQARQERLQREAEYQTAHECDHWRAEGFYSWLHCKDMIAEWDAKSE